MIFKREVAGRLPSFAAYIYHTAYALICGKHPSQRPWHFQWLPVKDLHRDIRYELMKIPAGARLLDVGCGGSPYKRWLPKGVEYTGLDIDGVATADIAVAPGQPWPVESGSYDYVLCTQVLEHVVDFEGTLTEIHKALKRGGRLITTVPFLYQEHGTPHDYRRLSRHGLRTALEQRFDVESLYPQGGIGSSVGTLILNWLDLMQSYNTAAKIIRVLILPLWIPFCFIVNMIGALLDKADPTGLCYGNVMAVGRKK